MARHSFFCIDAHTCGNPVRVVAGGGPLLPNVPMAEKRQIFMEQHDWVRRALMFEPRGHDVMSGSILYPPTRDDCELGVLYIEVSGCLPMCGHGTIGTVTVAIEEGLVQPRTPGRFAIEAPAGRVEVEYVQDGPFVEQVRLHNVPAYLHAADVPIDRARARRAADRRRLRRQLLRHHRAAARLARPGRVQRRRPDPLEPGRAPGRPGAVAPVHPEDARIHGVTHIQWCGPPRDKRAHARNAVFYGTAAIDRSPCGTGSSARMAQLVADGRLAVGESSSTRASSAACSIAGWRRRPMSATAPRSGPSVAGWARITGHNTIFVDDRDPFAHGFQVS